MTGEMGKSSRMWTRGAGGDCFYTTAVDITAAIALNMVKFTGIS